MKLVVNEKVNITNKFGIHIIRCKKWHRLQKFIVIFGTNYICKFINRTFAKENLLWYNLSIKGGFTMNNALFEQFGVTYTKQGNYLLPNLNYTGRRRNRLYRSVGTPQVKLPKASPQSFVLKSAHFRKTPFSPCRYKGTSPTTFSPVGK